MERNLVTEDNYMLSLDKEAGMYFWIVAKKEQMNEIKNLMTVSEKGYRFKHSNISNCSKPCKQTYSDDEMSSENCGCQSSATNQHEDQ